MRFDKNLIYFQATDTYFHVVNKRILLYALLFASLLILFKGVEYQFFSKKLGLDIYLGVVALVFLGIGACVGFIFFKAKKKERVPETLPPSPPVPQAELLSELGLSDRESEVLALICEGLSNQEIADRLFISIHTVKSHVASLYAKMDVKRRTQAVQKAKSLNIIP